jgi:hypothetical protein
VVVGRVASPPWSDAITRPTAAPSDNHGPWSPSRAASGEPCSFGDDPGTRRLQHAKP